MDIAMDPVIQPLRSLCSIQPPESKATCTTHKSGDDLAMVNMALALP